VGRRIERGNKITLMSPVHGTYQGTAAVGAQSVGQAPLYITAGIIVRPILSAIRIFSHNKIIYVILIIMQGILACWIYSRMTGA
jgi:hypothetical protein